VIFVEDFPQIDDGLSAARSSVACTVPRCLTRCHRIGAVERSPVIHVHDFLRASPRFDLFDKKAERADIGRSGAATHCGQHPRNELHRLDGITRRIGACTANYRGVVLEDSAPNGMATV
jgi:hypothetical protein